MFLPTLVLGAEPHARIKASAGESLAAARDQARAARGATTQPVIIELAGGTYVLTEPLVLGPEDSGETWQAKPGETPVLSGGRRITGWHAATLNGHDCWAADVPGVKDGKWFFRELWVNDRRATRARQPNTGLLRAVDSPDAGANWEEGQARFRFAGTDIPIGPFSHGAEAIIGTRWVESRLPLEAVDPAQRLASFARKSQWRIEPGEPYRLEGDARWLDQPGEWFLDRAGGTIYYLPQPGETLEMIDAVAPALVHLVEIKGSPTDKTFVEDLTFGGITFSHTEWNLPEPNPATTQPVSGGYAQADLNVPAAIRASGVRRVVFDRCTVRHIGTWAIDLGTSSRRCRVDRCTLEDLGAGGVRLGDPEIHKDAELQSSNNVITDCTIADGGNMFPSAVGVWIGQSSDNRVEHNEIRDFLYSGISAGWTWGYGDSLNRGNVIAFNRVHHIGKTTAGAGPLLSDMGGVYLLGARQGTVVRNNVFHDVAGVKYGGWGVYLDEGSSDTLIENNLVYRTTHGGFHQHYGRENLIRNNIFAEGGTEQQIVRTREEDHLSFTFEHNLVYWTSGSPMTRSGAKNVKFDHNLYGPAPVSDFRTGAGTWDQWRAAGQDTHSLVADAMFVDAAKSDFHLKPESPAEEIGFKPFDWSDVGPRKR